MKAENLERSNILNMFYDTITVPCGWGLKTVMQISNTYVVAKYHLASIKIFIYHIENILEQILLFHFFKNFVPKGIYSKLKL